MVEHVVGTLRKSAIIDRIAVVGPKDELEYAISGIADYVIEGTGSIVTNIIMALECFPEANRILAVTSDIPMITKEAIEDFIERCMEKDVICATNCRQEGQRSEISGNQKDLCTALEGRFTGGNVFCFNPAIKDKCRDFVEKMLEQEKPAKMAGVLALHFSETCPGDS